MTASSTWATQLMLPRQAAAPEGPIDLAGMYLMHRGFRRDLDAFVTATENTPADDRGRWARLSRRFGLFADVLHKHHRGEDVGLWPLLYERGADPAVLDALEAEHEGIDPLLTACRAELAELARGGDEGLRRSLADRMAQLRDLLHAHLAREESDGMTEVQAHLTPEDWDRLDKEVFAKEYRPSDIPAVLGWVASGLSRDEAMRMPGATAAMWPLARPFVRRFDRAEARTFGARS
jgi:hemerythrin HHE cation binding domain-containing protein